MKTWTKSWVSWSQAARGVAAVLGLLCASGCATTPKNAARYTAYSQTMTNLCCMIDASALADVSGSVDELNVSNNAAMAQQVFACVTNELAGRGYAITHPPVISIGGSPAMPQIKVAGAGPSPSGETPPPYILGGNGASPGGVRGVFRALHAIRPSAAGASLASTECEVLQSFAGGPVLIITLEGRSVSKWKGLGQGLATGLLTLGTVSMWQTTFILERLYIVDAASGEIVWADSQFLKGGYLTADTAAGHARRMVNRVPARSIP